MDQLFENNPSLPWWDFTVFKTIFINILQKTWLKTVFNLIHNFVQIRLHFGSSFLNIQSESIFVDGNSGGYIRVSCKTAKARAEKNNNWSCSITCVAVKGSYLTGYGKSEYKYCGKDPIPIHSVAPSPIAINIFLGASLQRKPWSCPKNAKNGILIPAWWKTPAEAKSNINHTYR